MNNERIFDPIIPALEYNSVQSENSDGASSPNVEGYSSDKEQSPFELSPEEHEHYMHIAYLEKLADWLESPTNDAALEEKLRNNPKEQENAARGAALWAGAGFITEDQLKTKMKAIDFPGQRAII